MIRPLTKVFRSYLTTKQHLKVALHEQANGELSTDRLAELKQRWARSLLDLQGFELVTPNPPPRFDGPALFVGNHVSFWDIPLLMSQTELVFVAKRELGNWPAIGPSCKLVGTIFVDRESARSRRSVLFSLEEAFHAGKRVVTFPAGTTYLREDKPWKPSVFKLAKKLGVPVYPFRLFYDPVGPLGYIGDDIFGIQLFRSLRLHRCQAFIEFGAPLGLDDPLQASHEAREWAGRAHRFSLPENQR